MMIAEKDVAIIRQSEIDVRGPDGANKFITIVGTVHIVPESCKRSEETYTWLVGPAFEQHEILGAAALASIAGLDLKSLATADCTLTANATAWDEDTKRVEVSVDMAAGSAVGGVTVVFGVTLLVAG